MTEAKTSAAVRDIREQLGKVLLGQPELGGLLMVCLFSGGHVLIEGIPGLGKTLAVRALAKAMDVRFSRIQFTPDIMPSDVVGSSVFDFDSRQFHLRRGPVFTNFLLADEINRTPPKTQSALLECMEESRVSIDGTDYELDRPFMVFATQNPIEFEGTYPLPEAQLDRFMMKLRVTYPGLDAEAELLRNYQRGFNSQDFGSVKVERVLDAGAVMQCRAEAQGIRVDERVISYILQIVDATRRNPYLTLGASPRASVALLQSSKALALMENRDFVIPEDVYYLAPHVLRHRLILTPDSEMDGLTPETIIGSVLANVQVPR